MKFTTVGHPSSGDRTANPSGRLSATLHFTHVTRNRLPQSKASFKVGIVSGAALLLLVCLASRSANELLIAIVAIALFAWAVHRIVIDPTWLIFALPLEETFPYLNFLPFDPDHRWFLRLPILVGLCVPVIPSLLRSGILKRGYFRLFLVYLGFAALSIAWSLAPGVSLGRLFANLLLFIGLSSAASRITTHDDVQRALGRFLLACGILAALEMVALFLVPQSVAIEGELTPGIYTWTQDSSGILRFSGFFGTINEVGALMVSTVVAGLAHWRFTRGWHRWALALTMAASLVLGAAADSRSGFIAVAVGLTAYSIWKYGFRAIAICSIAAILALSMYGLLDRHQKVYVNRDVGTLTGRSYIWSFELDKLKARPLIGFGYDVEGQIFQDRYFQNWETFFDQGPNTSLHEGYISVAIGLGVPVSLFWLFIFVVPLLSVFSSSDDPWHLRPLVLLIAIPIMAMGLDETGVAEPRYMHGVLMFLLWMIAEHQRLAHPKETISQWEIRPDGVVDYQRLFARIR